MGKIRFGVGTYILRKEAEKDLNGVLERLAAIGYDGVELLGFFGREPSDIRKKLDALGICALGDHVPYDAFLSEPDKVIDEHLEVGCGYVTIAHQQGQFVPGTQEYGDMLTGMRALIAKCLHKGLTPQYHNHGWDVLGDPSYADSLLGDLAKDGLCLEPDLGWMAFSRADPAAYLKRHGAHCPVLHFKDVYADDYAAITKPAGDLKGDPANGGFEFRPTGYGTVNFPALMPLCLACDPKWMVVDHDLAYERDTYEDLRLSLEYTKALYAMSLT